LVVTAIVLPHTRGKTRPTGSVTFLVDGIALKPAKKLDRHGRGRLTLDALKLGNHTIRAVYSGGGEDGYYPSSSPNLLHAVTRKKNDAVAKVRDHTMPMG